MQDRAFKNRGNNHVSQILNCNSAGFPTHLEEFIIPRRDVATQNTWIIRAVSDPAHCRRVFPLLLFRLQRFIGQHVPPRSAKGKTDTVQQTAVMSSSSTY